MRFVTASETVGHADFYSSTTAVVSLIFISITLLLFTPKFSDSGQSRYPTWRIWVAGLALVTLGIAIPLAILAGFIQDTLTWRQLAFIVTVMELISAASFAVLSVAGPESKASTGSGNGQPDHQKADHQD